MTISRDDKIEDNVKYRDDRIFQLLEKNYLTLRDEDVKAANKFLKDKIEEHIIPLMRQDELFHLLFQNIMYGGSFYKGTRYGKPEEFDLVLVIKLPFSYDYLKVDTNNAKHGYVKIKVEPQALNTPNWLKHRNELSKWLTADNYFDQNKFHNWMEKIITTALSKLGVCRNNADTCSLHTHYEHKKTGPAFTLGMDNAKEKIRMDVDLVPAIKFDNVPLGNGYKIINGEKKSWMAIAKPLSADIPNQNILWRLCFYEQEKDFLQGELKPVIRMLKKFRDTMKWDSIASYYLETLLYNELEHHKNERENFLRASKTNLFVFALKKLQDAFKNHYLPYFWNKNYNLLKDVSEQEIYSYSNRLNKILRSIESCIADEGRLILAEILLEDREIDHFKRDYARNGLSKLRL